MGRNMKRPDPHDHLPVNLAAQRVWAAETAKSERVQLPGSPHCVAPYRRDPQGSVWSEGLTAVGVHTSVAPVHNRVNKKSGEEGRDR
jgi:hypothetical protein